MPKPFKRIGRTPYLFVCDDFAEVRELAQVLRHVNALELTGHPCTRVRADDAGIAYEVPCDTLPLLGDLARRIEQASGLRNAAGDTFRFRRYGIGEAHPPHVDSYKIGGKHLIATAILYLTSPQDGGETLFPKALPDPVAVRARAQRLALWFNMNGAGQPEDVSAHESAAVAAGVKATLGYFIYGRPADLKRSPLLARKPL